MERERGGVSWGADGQAGLIYFDLAYFAKHCSEEGRLGLKVMVSWGLIRTRSVSPALDKWYEVLLTQRIRNTNNQSTLEGKPSVGNVEFPPIATQIRSPPWRNQERFAPESFWSMVAQSIDLPNTEANHDSRRERDF